MVGWWVIVMWWQARFRTWSDSYCPGSSRTANGWWFVWIMVKWREKTWSIICHDGWWQCLIVMTMVNSGQYGIIISRTTDHTYYLLLGEIMVFDDRGVRLMVRNGFLPSTDSGHGCSRDISPWFLVPISTLVGFSLSKVGHGIHSPMNCYPHWIHPPVTVCPEPSALWHLQIPRFLTLTMAAANLLSAAWQYVPAMVAVHQSPGVFCQFQSAVCPQSWDTMTVCIQFFGGI